MMKLSFAICCWLLLGGWSLHAQHSYMQTYRGDSSTRVYQMDLYPGGDALLSGYQADTTCDGLCRWVKRTDVLGHTKWTKRLVMDSLTIGLEGLKRSPSGKIFASGYLLSYEPQQNPGYIVQMDADGEIE